MVVNSRLTPQNNGIHSMLKLMAMIGSNNNSINQNQTYIILKIRITKMLFQQVISQLHRMQFRKGLWKFNQKNQEVKMMQLLKIILT